MLGATMLCIVQGVLTEHERTQLIDLEEHMPNTALSVMARLIEQTSLPEWKRQMMHEQLTKLAEVTAICERLIKTPIPRSYTR